MATQFEVRARERVMGRGMEPRTREVSLDGPLSIANGIDWKQAFSSAGMSPGSMEAMLDEAKTTLLDARASSNSELSVVLLKIQTRSPRIEDVTRKLHDLAKRLGEEGFECHVESNRVGKGPSLRGGKDTRETEVRLVATFESPAC